MYPVRLSKFSEKSILVQKKENFNEGSAMNYGFGGQFFIYFH